MYNIQKKIDNIAHIGKPARCLDTRQLHIVMAHEV